MKKQLIIKNIGPIKKAELDLNKINIFMGQQSSGKSTIAKIISYCNWVEKDIATRQSYDDYESNKDLFINKLISFHKLNGYIKSNSEIHFKSDILDIDYSNKNTSIKWNNQYEYKRSKISYIPSERTVAMLPEINQISFPDNYIRSFIFDWLTAQKLYSKENDLSIINLGLHYYYSEESQDNHIVDIENEYDILLSNASSGLQSMTPLVVMIDYLTEKIYSEDNESFETHKNKNTAFTKIAQSLTKQEKLTNKLSDKKSFEIFEQTMNILHELFVTQNSNLIIEEPEQNLFPSTQKSFVYYLLEKIQTNPDNLLTITTHSPYILYAINNCIMANIVQEKLSESEKEKLPCYSAAIDPKNISIYQINNGELINIQEEDGLISNNYFDEKMQEIMDEYDTMLNYFE